MASSNESWPNFMRRMSATISNDDTVFTREPAGSQPPALPQRPHQQLYSPQQQLCSPQRQLYQPQQWTDPSQSMSSLSAGLDFADSHQSLLPRRESLGAPRAESGAPQTEFSAREMVSTADDRPPTTERIPEFVLDIPAGVRCATHHPGGTIVGSVVVTVTKPTKATRIRLTFLGQQRVYVREPTQAPLTPHTNVDHTMFDKQLVLWGRALSDGDAAQDTLLPGTLRVPFSIRMPRVNYPATLKRDKVGRIRYLVWATLERPGTFVDHTLTTHKEELCFEPTVYPQRVPEALHIGHTISGKPDSTTAHVAVEVTGCILHMPAVAGDRVMYQLEARTRLDHNRADADDTRQTDAVQWIIRFMRVYVVERLRARALIRGREQMQTTRTDIHAVTLVSDASKPPRISNSTNIYSSSGYLRLPLDMCPFDSKQLKRMYELRVECDVVDKSSLLDKVTRHKSTYAMRLPLDVCTVAPDDCDPLLMQVEPDSLLPPHHKAASEPALLVGGWELEQSFVKWDKFNPTWVELARKRSAD
ncbi:hypothetical protein LPJ63_004469 [Coemansia sp. RSA 2711]|nr:hypothetical protein LPJ63_004469 [Coemansia sp. RSA 2711]KAJ2316897.1 hypothetical protein IWW52_003409 [Coemansia sp. RSA 2704]